MTKRLKNGDRTCALARLASTFSIAESSSVPVSASPTYVRVDAHWLGLVEAQDKVDHMAADVQE
jgi:hypothetical protein